MVTTKIYRIAAIFAVAVFLSGFFAGDLLAKEKEAALKDIVVANSETSLLLYMTVENGFRADMETGVMNGIPATFTFFVTLHRVRSGWPDREEFSLTFDHMLEYDNLKEEFVIRYGEKGGRIVKTKALSEAKTLMSEVNGLEFYHTADLDPDAEYIISVKTRLARKTLPLYMHYLIPFWKLADYETKWYEIKLKY